MRSALLTVMTATAATTMRCQPIGRRHLVGLCGCGFCGCATPQKASAFAEVVRQPSESLYDVQRDGLKDQGFARGMATGMKQYEKAVEKKKTKWFTSLIPTLPSKGGVVVELGMGSFPNAPFYMALPVGQSPREIEIVGIDPNDYMAKYGTTGPDVDRLKERGYSLREIHGVAEALPLKDSSVDAVVCTLTLCSVPDPVRALAEVKRVLKPGGRFLFLEHVLSETDAGLAAQQVALTPLQVASADGCHLDRRTLQTIKAAGFSQLDAEYFDLQGFYYLNPTVAGIAVR